MAQTFRIRRSASGLLLTLILTVAATACSVNDEPQPIELGKDLCEGCKMAITDGKFGCELITDKGRCLKFDDLSCLFHYIGKNRIDDNKVLKIYVGDYMQPDKLIDIRTAGLVLGNDIPSPMNGGVAAFSDLAVAKQFAIDHKAILLDSWTRLKQQHQA